MELRHLRYFVAVGEEEHYGRAARRLRLAQPALSRQIQDLEQEIGFRLFDRLPRGVKINEAGKLFLNDARRILQEINDATARAKRIASGLVGTLRIGFLESISWHGIIPLSSLEQIAAIQSGSIDAGFAVPLANPESPVGALPSRHHQDGFGRSQGTRAHEAEENPIEGFG